jgi:uncharacterized protein (DUF2267 family)
MPSSSSFPFFSSLTFYGTCVSTTPLPYPASTFFHLVKQLEADSISTILNSMKLTIAAVFTFGSDRSIVSGFSQVSFIPTVLKRTSLAASSGDPYGSLLKKLYDTDTWQLTSASSPPVILVTATSSPPVAVTPNLESGIADTQLMFHDALSLTIDAANKAASASAEVSKLSSQFRNTGTTLFSSISNNAIISDMMADAQAKLTEMEPDVSKLSLQFRPGSTEGVSNAMVAVQSKLAVLEQQLNDIKTSSPASDADLNQISASLKNALDTSFHATEDAAKSTLAVLTSSVDMEAIAKILADMQTTLYELEQVRTAQPVSNDIDLSQLYAALNEALDISSNAADHASAASSAVVDRLVQLNLALGHSMTGIDLGAAIPPEIADLLHKQMDIVANQAVQNHGVLVQSVMNAADLEYSKLSSYLEGAFSAEVSAFVAVYGLLAFMAGYSQNLGEHGYKSEFREVMEGAKFDVDEVSGDIFTFGIYPVCRSVSFTLGTHVPGCLCWEQSTKTNHFYVSRLRDFSS